MDADFVGLEAAEEGFLLGDAGVDAAAARRDERRAGVVFGAIVFSSIEEKSEKSHSMRNQSMRFS